MRVGVGVKRGSSKGFTLLEVFVATLLISIIAMGTAMGFSSAYRFRRQSRHLHAANVEANALLERAVSEIDSSRFSGSTMYFDKEFNLSSSRPDETWIFDGEAYPVTIEVGTSGKKFLIDVTVEWGRAGREIELRGEKFDMGI
jgi:prepilin-type N-terminal cleavage/methylation domain-containing protein